MFPWQAMIQHRSTRRDAWDIKCGAVFISERWLITAAHCVDGRFGNRRIVYGFSKQFEPDKKIGQIKRFITHPKFERNADLKKDMFFGENDIALVELKAPIQFTEASNAVALSNNKHIIDFQACTITGWGFLNSGGKLISIEKEGITKLIFDRIPNYTK
ncbi:TMPRSS11E [Mytilus edulis]|uniref:TMPRSS11E n=1 Tax=Mytilus edulis TaxID=6550 RepID=A0A8S3QCR3_MYTED|nr:TMPRSS11E [Mytilus edulis]